ncbi:von Willebrand factor type A domain-containing protein [Paraburkholderia steynii]|uniref:von Willebrand factor type A domain-containing protein n=1 Tax=Paraburkholderia steynii TaxID=1245441 RepID=A0A7Z7FQX8_9BURK|nr:M64 family metallopeptidase [Paraburkholderia steynii]SDJ46880.1 von Willebrand factor type A domain-containing protein [Paraburkholderia steynii]
MSTSDGYVLGTHKIVDHGPTSQRFNIVIMGDGYQASEQEKYATDVKAFIDLLRSTAPYTDLWCGINVFRIDVVSTDSGADDPGTCGDGSTGSGATPRTYFDSTFCSDGDTRRLLSCNDDTAINLAIAQVPAAHEAVMVIVNTNEYGGSSDGRVAKFSTAPNSAEIALHEMGHLVFGFADEYDCRTCVAGETGHDHYSGPEPPEPNVTINTDRNTMKWRASLTSTTDALPTTTNADCTTQDTQANPQSATYVGAYDGADYFHCGCYRPSFNCRMRALGNPFCLVCQQAIRDALHQFLPAESLTLTTPSIAFDNVPEGLGGVGVTTYRAIVFEVVTCATRTFRITAGPTGGFGTPLGTSISVSANDNVPIEYARLWLSYTSTTAGSTSHGTVTVQCDETGQTWVVNIIANTVARPKSAVTFVLDHSGSMSEDAGDGATKVGKLREAASIFINAMLDGDGLGIVRFDDTAQLLMPVTNVGPPVLGGGRIAATGHISGPELDPAGNTSIGAGVVAGKNALDAAQALGAPHYDVTAMLVLTDGEENTAPFLSAVGSSITANTFAIGLGQPENISTAALTTLTQGHSGYLLITGQLTPDQSARLNKYFLQILAGITNAQIVLDPHGLLTPGATHRIPFQMAETDYGLDVFLLTQSPWLIEFALEAPNGDLISPASVTVLTNLHYVQTAGLAYFRLSLPAEPAKASGTRAGLWHVLLKIAGRKLDVSSHNAVYASGSSNAQGLPYDVVIHTYSNLVFEARATQSSFDPGATISVVATLSEYDVPIDDRAHCWAEVTRPDGSMFTVTMSETDPGRFSGQFIGDVAGLYAMRVRATGSTFTGNLFQREQTLTAAVYLGATRPPETGGTQQFDWCAFLRCMINGQLIDRAAVERLRQSGVNLDVLAKCLEAHCSSKRGS